MRVSLAGPLSCAMALCAAPDTAHTDEPSYYVYAQNLPGKLSANGTVLEELPGDFAVDDDEVEDADEGWAALAVEGSRRWSLRYDGQVRRDGTKLRELPRDDDWWWVSMAVDGGSVCCLRDDGVVDVDGQTLVDLPMEGFVFRRLAARDGHVYTLRTDGALFVDDRTDPVYRFHGDRGPASWLPDGFAGDTLWVALTLHPTLPYVYAIHSDGTIRRGSTAGLGPGDAGLPGELVAELPFYYDWDADDDGDEDDYPLLDDVYVDIEFLSDGTWLALAGDGRVYSSTSGVATVIDFPGIAVEPDDSFPDLATHGTAFWAVRADGYVYRGDADVPRVDLPGVTYGWIVISTEPPDLGETDEHPPKCLVYATKTVVGTPLDIPVVATDIEMRAEDLVVSPTKLPSDASGSAATWDAAARTMRWHSPQVEGTYKFKFTVSDSNATSEFVFTFEVKAPETTTENKGPMFPALTGGKPIVGQPFSFVLVVDDRDGDPVQVTVKQDSFPFDAGATFDPTTLRFDWTPRPEDQGERTVKFYVYDGKEQKTCTVTLTVKNGLIF